MKLVVPGSAFSSYRTPSAPEPEAPSGSLASSAVKYQMHVSATMTETTTRLITVSWNIAYGWNCFPSRSTSSLYRWCCARRSSTALLATRPPSARSRTQQAPLTARLRLGALPAGRLLRPRRRADAEADHEVDVQ